jgi:hypothetical protein
MTYLLPGERLDGTAAERAHLRRLLVSFRTDPPPMRLPDVSGCPLPELLDNGTIDSQVFWTGYGIMACRYAQLGIKALLPLERVWVGTSSAAAPGTPCAYGGFHHPRQGYRHLQMDAAITVYGDLTRKLTASPQAIAVDLVRSYAHDCVHYGTFRRYQLAPGGEIARVQYGINLRRPDGRTYSAPDPTGTRVTRNLGILMEGATDAEATGIARQTADSSGISGTDLPEDMLVSAFADATGTLTADAVRAALASGHPYLRTIGSFSNAVTMRYQALLRDLADDPAGLHRRFVTAMASGGLAPLEGWLDARHGPGFFARRFRAPAFDAAAGPSGDAAPGREPAQLGIGTAGDQQS